MKFLVILLLIICGILMVCLFGVYVLLVEVRKKYSWALSEWIADLDSKDEEISELEKTVSELNIRLDAINQVTRCKFEQERIQPVTIECSFSIDERYKKDLDWFKKMCLNDTAMHLISELEKNPYLYQSMFENWCNADGPLPDRIRIQLRLLPYRYKAEWNIEGC